MKLFESCCLLFLPSARGFSSCAHLVQPWEHRQLTYSTAPLASYPILSTAEFSQERSASGDEVNEHEQDEELLLDELTSPEMALGMSTLSEESTVDAVLALSQVGAATRVGEGLLETTDTAVSVAPTEDSSLDLTREEQESSIMEAPSVRRILKFAIGAVVVWLCSPILSLIDTSVVGLYSGTAQQAALNPAVAVVEYTALLIVSINSRLSKVLPHVLY